MQDVQKQENGDINSLEDRIWGCANLVSLEEHAYSSWLRTHDALWLGRAESYRDMRQRFMRDILGPRAGEMEAEVWCMFKHLLGAAMRAMEASNRYGGEKAAAYRDMSRELIRYALEIAAMTSAAGAAEQRDESARPERDGGHSTAAARAEASFADESAEPACPAETGGHTPAADSPAESGAKRRGKVVILDKAAAAFIKALRCCI